MPYLTILGVSRPVLLRSCGLIDEWFFSNAEDEGPLLAEGISDWSQDFVVYRTFNSATISSMKSRPQTEALPLGECSLGWSRYACSVCRVSRSDLAGLPTLREHTITGRTVPLAVSAGGASVGSCGKGLRWNERPSIASKSRMVRVDGSTRSEVGTVSNRRHLFKRGMKLYSMPSKAHYSRCHRSTRCLH